jgi:2-polyprenyl-3-methyl-5-hydroxy-6-metoxy-1,4-benzoquinol methylase
MKSANNNHLWQVWDREADTWNHFVESGGDVFRHQVHGPGLLKMCGTVTGLQVLDMGCGQGYFSRELAKKGACVTGFDFSPRLVEIAINKENESPLGIDYIVLDAAKTGENWKPDTFDMITACMSVQDIQDPIAAIEGVSKILKQGGRFVFSIPHPCTDTKTRRWHYNKTGEKVGLTVNYYFDMGTDTFNWKNTAIGKDMITPFHRFTLSRWSGIFANAGLKIRKMHEPRPTKAQIKRFPQLAPARDVPYFMVFELVK